MEMEKKDGQANVCKCPHHKFVPGIVALMGFLFLLGNMSVMSADTVNFLWPILLMVIGLSKAFEDKCICC